MTRRDPRPRGHRSWPTTLHLRELDDVVQELLPGELPPRHAPVRSTRLQVARDAHVVEVRRAEDIELLRCHTSGEAHAATLLRARELEASDAIGAELVVYLEVPPAIPGDVPTRTPVLHQRLRREGTLYVWGHVVPVHMCNSRDDNCDDVDVAETCTGTDFDAPEGS